MKVALSILLAASPCFGQSESPAPGDSPPSEPGAPAVTAAPLDGDGRRTLRRLPANLGRGFVGVFDTANLPPFLVGGVATAAVSFVDKGVRDAVADPESGFGAALEWPGEAPLTTVPVIALFAAGRLVHDSRFRAMSYDLGEAAFVTFGYTALLKVAVQRERPDGSDRHSFPSGHASHAFTLAAVSQHHYGWKLGVPMYAAAAVVSYSRLVRDKHYLSDVVAGATLGFVVGRTVVRMNDRPLDAPDGKRARAWSVAPLVGPGVRGLQLAVSY